MGRFAGAGLVFLFAAGIRHFGALGTPAALTALPFVVALALLPFGEETRGKPSQLRSPSKQNIEVSSIKTHVCVWGSCHLAALGSPSTPKPKVPVTT